VPRRNGNAGRPLSTGEDGVSRGRPRKATGGGRALRAALAAALLLSACAPADDPGPVVGSPAPAYGARHAGGGFDRAGRSAREGRAPQLLGHLVHALPPRDALPGFPARAEIPEGLEVVGVSMDAPDARDEVADFVRELGVGYTILLDPRMRGSDLYRVVGLPASFLVDRDGILRWMRFGP